MTDVMIDIETLGKGRDALILSIGAVEFNLKAGVIGKEFSQRIDVASSQGHGAKLDASTVVWWMGQSELARASIGNGKGMMLPEALDSLTRFLYNVAPACDMALVNVWGNGSTFDISILEDSYKLVGQPEAWSFRNVRDMRTMVDLYGRMGVSYRKSPVAHTALADAREQANHLIHLQNMLYLSLQGAIARDA